MSSNLARMCLGSRPSIMPMELRKMDSWEIAYNQHPHIYIARRSPYPYGRHHDLVNGDSLEECSKASCALPTCAKRELDFEILVPATDSGTWRCPVTRTPLHENARGTYLCPPQKEGSERCERRRSDNPAYSSLRVKSGRTFERYRILFMG